MKFAEFYQYTIFAITVIGQILYAARIHWTFHFKVKSLEKDRDRCQENYVKLEARVDVLEKAQDSYDHAVEKLIAQLEKKILSRLTKIEKILIRMDKDGSETSELMGD